MNTVNQGPAALANIIGSIKLNYVHIEELMHFIPPKWTICMEIYLYNIQIVETHNHKRFNKIMGSQNYSDAGLLPDL